MPASRTFAPGAVLVAAVLATGLAMVNSHTGGSALRASTGPATHAAGPVVSTTSPTSKTAPQPWAVVSVSGGSLLLERDGTDSDFALCPGSPAVTLAPELVPGDFITSDPGPSGSCVSSLSLVAPPQPPHCGSAGAGSYSEVLWVDVNQAAQSVLYQLPGADHTVLAARWCRPPNVLATDGAVMPLTQFTSGAAVRLVSSSDGWVTEIIAQPKTG